MNIKKSIQDAKEKGGKALGLAKGVGSLSGKTKTAIAGSLLTLSLGTTAINSGYEGYVSDPSSKAESTLLIDQEVSQDALSNGESVFNTFNKEDQQGLIEVFQNHNIPKSLYTREDGSYFISNENIYIIKDQLVTAFSTEQDEAKKHLWRALIALASGALALVAIRRQHDHQDKAIKQMYADSEKEDLQDKMSQIRAYLNKTLPEEASSIEMLFEMASYPDIGVAREQLEKEYLKELQKSHDKTQELERRAKSIHDVVSGVVGYNYDPNSKGVDGAGSIRDEIKKLNQYKITQVQINPLLTEKIRTLASEEKKLEDSITKLEEIEPTTKQAIKKDNVQQLINAAREVNDLKKLIANQKLQLTNRFEEIRTAIKSWYDQYSIENKEKVDQIKEKETLGEQEFKTNKEKIKKLMELGRNWSENKDQIVSSIFPKADDKEQHMAKEKFEEYQKVISAITATELEIKNLDEGKDLISLEGDTGKSVDQITSELSEGTQAMLESGLTIQQCNKNLLFKLEAAALKTTFEIEYEDGSKETKKLSDYIIVNPDDKSISGSPELVPYLNNETQDSEGKLVTIGDILTDLISLNQECLLVKQLGRQWKYEEKVNKLEQNSQDKHQELAKKLEELTNQKNTLEAEVAKYAALSSAIDLDNHKKDILSQALTNTIEALAGDGKQYTADEIYDTFFRETMKLDPDFVEARYGIKELNNQRKIDKSIIRKFVYDLGITAATSSMMYHTMRGLLNILPSHPGFLGEKLTHALTGGNGLLDTQNIPLALTSLGLGWAAHRYIDEYETNMKQTQEYQMSGKVGFKEIFFNNPSKSMYVCIGVYFLLQGLDLIGAASTGASTAIKEKNAKVTTVAYDKLAGKTDTFNDFVAQAASENKQGAIQTIIDESDAGGAGPLTADKFNLTYKKGSKGYKTMLNDALSPKKKAGFDEALASDTPGVSNLESVNNLFTQRMNETRSLMHITRNGKEIAWNQIPQYMKSLGSDLADVNTANQVDDIKRKFKSSARSVVAKLKQDLQWYAEETNKLNSEYQKIGGQPIAIKPIDPKVTSQQIESITKAVDEFVKSLDGSVTYFDLTADGISDMVDTISELSLGQKTGIISWMSIVSVLAMWLAAFKFFQTRSRIKKKDENSEQIDEMIKDSREEFISTISEFAPGFDSNRLTTIADEWRIKKTITAEQDKINVEMNDFVYTSDLDSNPSSIPLIRKLFNESIREEYKTHQSSYTDWVLDHHTYNDNQLWLIILDLFTNSPTFRQELIEEITYRTEKEAGKEPIINNGDNTKSEQLARNNEVKNPLKEEETQVDESSQTANGNEDEEQETSLWGRGTKRAKSIWNKRPNLFK